MIMGVQPKVCVVLGSESDLNRMQGAIETLSELGIPFELRIASAHRAPSLLDEIASDAEARGIKVFIAGAGGAAHLPGVLASRTLLPVVGVPLQGWVGSGEDALFSMVQMPPGIPVATVAINGARNGALLAAAILGLSDGEIRERLQAFRQAMEARVREQDAAVRGAPLPERVASHRKESGGQGS